MANDNLFISIEAKLDTGSGTLANIENDIKILNDAIRGKEQYMLKLGVKIDTDNINYADLQNQLTEIGKKATINVGNIEVGGLTNVVTNIKTNVEGTVSKVKQEINNANITASDFVSTLNNLASTSAISKVQISDAKEYANAISQIADAIRSQGGSVEVLDYNKWLLEGGKNLDSFSLKVKNLNGEIATLKYTLNTNTSEDNIFTLANISGDNTGIEKQIKAIQNAAIESDRYKSKVIDLTSALETLNSKYTDPNAAKAITADEELIRLYDVAKSKIELVGSANKETFKSLVADTEAALTAYQNYAKTLQTAQYAATNLRVKDIDTNISIAKNSLLEFENTVRASKVPLQVMEDDLKGLSDKLSKVSTSSDFTEYLNQLDIAKSKFQSFKTLYTANEGLEKIPSQIAAIESRFQTLTNKPEELKNLIEQIKVKLGEIQGMSEGDISSVKAKVTAYQELAKMVGEANNKTKELAATQRSDDSAVLLSQKVQKLIQDVNAYINANQKAVQSSKLLSTGNTVQQEMNGILASLRNVSTTSEFNKINAHFRTMKSEIKATGLEGTTALGKLWENIKKFGGWMSITSSVTRVFMYIRRAITELKDIDTILTEISKTSDRTTQSLEKLGATSFDVASKYGQKASDYLKGVQEMSRAGFGETQSEQMAELSTLAQSAGDMTADLANQYLIATNAAYGLAGNTKELNKVLDSQNYITNHNALSMTDLAEATKLAASQAHASGIGVDELTAALGTMIAVTQQGGDTAARAFKGKRALSTNARYR